jgi:anhydro-N-acetylmuramic acid kinase
MLAAKAGKAYDDGGAMAASGQVLDGLLEELNALPYYAEPFPKSLANDFGTDVVFPKLEAGGEKVEDLLRTYVEHIAVQTCRAVEQHAHELGDAPSLVVTGGGAFNRFLVDRLRDVLAPLRVQVELPDEKIINFKEALIMGLLGVLRWRDEATVLSSVTGASRDSVGGAIWNAGTL